MGMKPGHPVLHSKGSVSAVTLQQGMVELNMIALHHNNY
jgi:hypothetical protein